MRDDLDPLSTLYGRFDAITKELAERRVSVGRRTARNQRLVDRQPEPIRHVDTTPAPARPIAAAPPADLRQSRLNVLKADVSRSLQRVCPIMPAEELERLATRIAVSEMAHEERAMAASSVHTRHRADDVAPTANGRERSGNATT
jgi:hypothetical protein